MHSLYFDGEQLKLSEQPKPEFRGEESLIRLLKAGICNTDLEITRGYFGFKGVLGHEFVGRVEASRNPDLVGKRVVGEINAACGRCDYCQKSLQRHCPNRSVLGILNRDGAFREYLTLPEDNLHVVPEVVSDEAAVFTEPLAAACEILDQVRFQPADKIAILGDGKLGLLIAMVLAGMASSMAANVGQTILSAPQTAIGGRMLEGLTLIGKHAEKMQRVASPNIRTLAANETAGWSHLFDVVVEATGSPAGWEQALSLVKPRGTVVLKSTFHGQVAFNPAPIVVDEITIIGSRCGRFAPALQMLAEKRIDPTRLLQHSLPLSRGIEAFELAQKPGALKVVLEG